jgi:hypothetical protein
LWRLSLEGITELVAFLASNCAASIHASEFLTTSTTPRHIQENFEVSTLPEDAVREIRDGVTTSVRLNLVVETGVPGFF